MNGIGVHAVKSTKIQYIYIYLSKLFNFSEFYFQKFELSEF